MKKSQLYTKGQTAPPVKLQKNNKLVTKEIIEANVGFLGTKGKFLKFLIEEKKRERNL